MIYNFTRCNTIQFIWRKNFSRSKKLTYLSFCGRFHIIGRIVFQVFHQLAQVGVSRQIQGIHQLFYVVLVLHVYILNVVPGQLEHLLIFADSVVFLFE